MKGHWLTAGRSMPASMISCNRRCQSAIHFFLSFFLGMHSGCRWTRHRKHEHASNLDVGLIVVGHANGLGLALLEEHHHGLPRVDAALLLVVGPTGPQKKGKEEKERNKNNEQRKEMDET